MRQRLADLWEEFRLPLALGVAAGIVLGLLLSACGGTSLKAHSYAATTLDYVARVARETALEDRGEKLQAAGEQAQADGKDVTEAVNAAAVKYQARIDAVNGYIAAKDLYVRAVLLAAGQDKPSFATLLPVLRNAIAAYAGVRALYPSLPDIPDPIKELVP